jgi:hypothetical protein
LLTGIAAASTYGNANVVTLLSGFGSNTISTTGNISSGYLFGNGSQLTGIAAASTYGNANVVTLLAGFGSNVISTTGNITGGNILGTVATATYAVTAGTAATANSAAFAATATTANTAQYVTQPAQANITSVGTLTSLTSTGLISGNYYIEAVYAGGNTGTSVTPVQSNGSVQKFTANNNFTLNVPTGMTSGSSFTLIFTQDATGTRAMTANVAYKFAYGSKTLSTAASSIDVMSVFYDGTNYLCNLVKGYTA